MARASVFLLGGGGALGLLSIAVPGDPHRNTLAIALFCVAAIVLAGVYLLGLDRLPRRLLELTPTFATGLITLDLFVAGERTDAAPVFFFLVVLYAFHFFPVRTAMLQVALVAAAELAVAIERPTVLRPDTALVTLGVLTGSAYILQRSTTRLRGLVDDLLESRQELRRSREETIDRLSLAAEFRAAETSKLTMRMSRYCALLAEKVGLPPERCELIRMAAPLHDVGKIAVPDSILHKDGLLDAQELATMRTHAELGHRLLSGSGEGLLELASVIALTHHERWDGSGYPHGLVGEEIPLEGRIAAIADVFDALVSSRTYRQPLHVEEAVGIMREGRGSLFDPALLDLFVDSLDELLEIGGLRAGTAQGAEIFPFPPVFDPVPAARVAATDPRGSIPTKP
jgi:hypothetical protein